MDEGLLTNLAAAVTVATVISTSPAIRRVLKSVFRRPRETSVIITMDGKQIEVTGTSTATTQAAVELVLRRAFEADSEAAREDDTATSQAPDSEGTRSSGGAENE